MEAGAKMIGPLSQVPARTFPTAGTDANGGTYFGWASLNAGQVSFNVPKNYQAGTDISLRISEVTPGLSKNHKWQATSRLNNGTPQAFTAEYVSPAVSSQTPTVRDMVITLGGQVSGVSVAADDLFNIIIDRVAATSNEDPNSILSYSLDYGYVVGTIWSQYSGRVGSIIADVLGLANDNNTTDTFVTQTQILGFINDCTKEIVEQLKYWKTHTNITVTANVDPIDLIAAIPNLYEIYNLRWLPTTYGWNQNMLAISTEGQLQGLRQVYQQQQPPGQALGYYIQSNMLYLVPVFTQTVTNAIEIYHSYIPADMDGSAGNCTPPLPATFDKSVYVPFCRAQYSLVDRTGQTAEGDFQKYMSLFQQGIRRLAGQGTTPRVRMRPYN